MLSTYLAAYPWLAPTMLGLVVIVGPLVAWWLASWRTASGVLAALAAAAVGSLTLWPTPRDGIASGCEIDWSLRLWAPEPLANVVLLVPVTLLLAVAMRQPVLAALIGAAFAGAIELTQALVPDLGRACATSDWVANAAGAVLGAVLAGIGLWLARSSDRRRPEHAQGRTRR